MSSIYTSDGQAISSHVHRLERISDPVYKYRCVECNAQLQRLSGIIIKSAVHEVTKCDETGSTVRRGGHWILQFTCPKCGRQGKFHRNYLGQRVVTCDGLKFDKQEALKS